MTTQARDSGPRLSRGRGSIILFFVAHWLAAPVQDKLPRRRHSRRKEQINVTAGLREARSPGRRADGNGQHGASGAVCLHTTPAAAVH